ncbi:MAG: phosphoesterase, partial [Conexibacter sp.]|nr:phosphoesterase [Conexibacter sp.]
AGAFSAGSPLADLAARGAVLSGYAAAGPSAAVNEVALLGGQVPTADCATDVAACVLPAGETSLPDQLTSVNLTWRAYVEDAAQRCAATPSARVGVSLFTTLTSRDDCATNVVGLDALDADLADTAKAPALSLLVPTAADLHDLVARITASTAYRHDGVLVVLSDAPGAAGALVLSPRATAGATSAGATGPVALLRSLDDLFGLPALGAAADAPAGALDGVLARTPSLTPTTSTTTRRSP